VAPDADRLEVRGLPPSSRLRNSLSRWWIRPTRRQPQLDLQSASRVEFLISVSVISSTVIPKLLVLTTGVDAFKMGAWLGAGGGRNIPDSSDSGGVPANSSSMCSMILSDDSCGDVLDGLGVELLP
jgi:hypothetical protein